MRMLADPGGGAREEVRRYVSSTQKELDALMPSILDRAFNGQL